MRLSEIGEKRRNRNDKMELKIPNFCIYFHTLLKRIKLFFWLEGGEKLIFNLRKLKVAIKWQKLRITEM